MDWISFSSVHTCEMTCRCSNLYAGSAVNDIPAFLYEMGMVLRGMPTTGAQAGCFSPDTLPAAAARMAAFAVSMKWVHVVRLLLPLTLTSGKSPAAVVADMDASLPEGRYTPACGVAFMQCPPSCVPSEPTRTPRLPQQAWGCCCLRFNLGVLIWSESCCCGRRRPGGYGLYATNSSVLGPCRPRCRRCSLVRHKQ